MVSDVARTVLQNRAANSGVGKQALDPSSALEMPAKQQTTPAPQEASAQKLAELRARLIAQRSNTPVRSASQAPQEGANSTAKADVNSRVTTPNGRNDYSLLPSIQSSNAIDELLAEGEAFAQAQAADKTSQTTNTGQKGQNLTIDQSSLSLANKHAEKDQLKQLFDELANHVHVPNVIKPAGAKDVLSGDHGVVPQHTNSKSSRLEAADEPATTVLTQGDNMISCKGNEAVPASATPGGERSTSGNDIAEPVISINSTDESASTKASLSMTEPSTIQTKPGIESTATGAQELDQFDADLELWLRMTGFFDVEYRERRLVAHRKRELLENKRRALEAEFAAFEEEEAATALQDALRAQSVRAQSISYMPPPLVPASAMISVELAKDALETPRPERTFTPVLSTGCERPTPPHTGRDQPERTFTPVLSAGVKRPISPSLDRDKPPSKSSRLEISDQDSQQKGLVQPLIADTRSPNVIR